MLRSEHVIARLQRGKVVPHRLSPDDEKILSAASDIISEYVAAVGQPRSGLDGRLTALEEELGPRVDSRRGFRIVRALAKLLEERCNWDSPTETDPYTLRTRIFELASALPEPPMEDQGILESPTRHDVLSRVARETGVADPASLMFADRQSAQTLQHFDKPSPEELVLRYNVAQIQGVLYAAKDLVVDLDADADARLVFHYVKKMGLIHRIEPLYGGFGGYRIHLDGPLSLFGSTRKYGLRLAKFLPGLVLTSPWRLSATVDWKGRDATLELDSGGVSLTSHYLGPKTDEEQDEVVASFRKAWERAKDTDGWTLEDSSQVISVPDMKAALVPDFTLVNRETGEIAHLEILGFWSKRNLVDRTRLIREANSRGNRVLVAASEKLGASGAALSEGTASGIVPFKGKLAVRDVLAAVSAHAGKSI